MLGNIQMQNQFEEKLQQQQQHIDSAMAQFQENQYQLVANLTQVGARKILYQEQGEGENIEVHAALTNPLLTNFPARKQREKAPSEYEILKQEHTASLKVPNACVVGPIIDNAADEDILAGKDRKYFTKEGKVTPVKVDTVAGTREAESEAEMQVGNFLMKGIVLPNAKRSLAALHKLTQQGYTYVQTHRAAGLIKGANKHDRNCP